MFWLLGIFLVALVVFGFTPFVKYQLEKNLSTVTGQTVQIEQLTLKIFSSEAEITGLSIGTETTLDRLFVAYRLFPLLDNIVLIPRLELSGLNLPVVSNQQESSVAGVSLSTSEPVEEGTGEAPVWKVSLESLQLEDSQICVQINEVSHQLDVANTQLGPVHTHDKFATELISQLVIDGSNVSINGTADVEAEFEALSFNVALDLDGIQIERYTHFAELPALVGRLSLKQNISGQYSADAFDALLDGSVRVTDFSGVDQLTLGEARWNGSVDYSSSGSISALGDVDAMQAIYPELGSLRELNVGQLGFDGKTLAMESIYVAGVDARLERDPSGVLKLPQSASAAESSPADDTTESQALDIKIASVRLSDSRFEFVDRSTEPLVDLVLEDMTGSLENFSLQDLFQFNFTAQHHQASDAQLSIQGDFNLASLSGDVDVGLQGFELHEIAPYISNGVKSGRLRLNSDILMTDGHIKVDNAVHIKNVKIDERAASSGDQMSLSTALFMLKGSDDVIELEVPFETDFDNFEIGLADIIQTAMVTAARTAAVAYAQYALQPYGSLLFAKDMFGAITKPKFEPIKYEPTISALSSSNLDYVQKLGGFLKDRPELTVTVCGYAHMSEMDTLRAAALESETEPPSPEEEVGVLKQIAENRSSLVRAELIDAGVTEQQIYGCTAAVEAQAGSARVELAL